MFLFGGDPDARGVRDAEGQFGEMSREGKTTDLNRSLVGFRKGEQLFGGFGAFDKLMMFVGPDVSGLMQDAKGGEGGEPGAAVGKAFLQSKPGGGEQEGETHGGEVSVAAGGGALVGEEAVGQQGNAHPCEATGKDPPIPLARCQDQERQTAPEGEQTADGAEFGGPEGCREGEGTIVKVQMVVAGAVDRKEIEKRNGDGGHEPPP